MGIFRKMLKVDCFISRIPTSQKRSFTENGLGQLLWKRTRFSDRMFLLSHCSKESSKLVGGSRAFWLPLEPCPLATPASKPRGYTDAFLLSSKPACRGQIFKVRTNTFFLTPQERKRQAGTLLLQWQLLQTCAVWEDLMKIFFQLEPVLLG